MTLVELPCLCPLLRCLMPLPEGLHTAHYNLSTTSALALTRIACKFLHLL